MKRRTAKAAAALVGILLAAVITVSVVMQGTVEVQAADTFLGIQNLIQEVKQEQKTYTVLEIVPKQSDAEIGYLFDGQEPLLWVENDEGEQVYWKERLGDFAEFEDRKKFVEDLKKEIDEYFTAKGLTEYPVLVAGGTYEESDSPAEGYEKITFADEKKTGYFEKMASPQDGYNLIFEYRGKEGDNERDEEGTLYYYIPSDSVRQITEADRDNIPDASHVFKCEEAGVYTDAGTWGEIKDTLPSGTASGNDPDTVSDNDSGTVSDNDSGTVSDNDSGTNTNTVLNAAAVSDTVPDANAGGTGTEMEPAVGDAAPDAVADTDTVTDTDAVTDSTPDANAGGTGANVAPANDAGVEPVAGDADTDTVTNTATDANADTEPVAGDADAEPVAGDTNTNTVTVTDAAADTNAVPEADTNAVLSADAVSVTAADTNAVPEADTNAVLSADAVSVTAADANTDTNTDTDADTNTDTAPDPDTYYLVTFARIDDQVTLQKGDAFYSVQSIEKSALAEYKFEETGKQDGKLIAGTQEYSFAGNTIYCKNTFTSNEWFKQYVLNMTREEWSQFPVEVLTLTPEEVSDKIANNEELKFDFLYLNAGDAGNAYDADNDLSVGAAAQLFSRAVAGKIPCLVNSALLADDMKGTNVYLLAAMLGQESPEKYYNENGANASALQTVMEAAAAAAVQMTELQDKLADGMAPGADTGHFTTENVYFCSQGILNSDFAKATIYKDGGILPEGFASVLEEINLENLYRSADTSQAYRPMSTDISQAAVVRHIVNYARRRSTQPKKNIKVLEIQPAKVDKSELTLAQIQQWAPGVESAEIVTMTTAEFIGKIERLNETYDLIYIGASTEHLNVGFWTGDDKGGNTVFNDSDMDGLIYYNIGDLRGVAVQLAGQLDSEWTKVQNNGKEQDGVYYYNLVRYNGNDISAEKKAALLSFLNGSYPIIVSDDFIQQPVTVFDGENYAGYRISLPVGEYTKSDLANLGIKNDAVSSIKVQAGYKVTLYKNDNFKGTSQEITANQGSLSLNNQVSSIKVERVDGAAGQGRMIDGDHIDNCTYMYEFVSEAINKKYSNFYVWSEITDNSELFKFYLNRPKASLINRHVNGVANGNVNYVDADVNGHYTLEYTFTIQNEGAATSDTRYACSLFVDVNADGKFAASEKQSDITVTCNGAYVASDQLYAGKEYVLRREVPAGYKGVLPWRIEVCQVNNANIYTSMSGYTKLNGQEKEVLKIIQIGRESWWNGDQLLRLDEKIANQNDIFHVLVYGGTYGGVTYEGISDTFELQVTFKTISEFETEFGNNPDYLDDFNMLILGFSDMYGNFSGDADSGPMGAIVSFIDSGRSVLMAHDTTSFFNTTNGTPALPWRNNPKDIRYMPSGETNNAYTLNKYIRGLVGMDRYGIMDSAILKKGELLTSGTADFDAVVNSGKDVAYKPKSGKTATVPQVQGYTYALINAKDKKVDGDTSGNKSTFNKWELDLSRSDDWKFTNSYLNLAYDTVYFWNGNNGSDNGEMIYCSNGEVQNVTVTQVNSGQITEYPYKLASSFEVAATHAQYYQLDYTMDEDKDGQSDLVVWYCLGARANGEPTIYSMSPNDVLNNYYIYSKGNITYTGMGHSANASTKYTVEEAKLFINTLVASYRSSVKEPYVTILESGDADAAKLSAMYRFYDGANAFSLNGEASTEDKEKIFFTVQDVNFVSGGRKIEAHAWYEAEDGTETITVSGEEVKVNRLADEFFKTDGTKVDADGLQSGGVYYMLVPKAVLENCDGGLNLYLGAKTTASIGAKTYVTKMVYAKLEVYRTYLYNLE